MGHHYFPTPYSIFFLSTSVRVPLYPIRKCTFRKVMLGQNVSHRWDAVAQHNGALLKLGRLVTAQCGSRTHRLAEATSFSGHLLPTFTSIPLDIMEKNSIIRTPLTPSTFLWLDVRMQQYGANTEKKRMWTAPKPNLN